MPGVSKKCTVIHTAIADLPLLDRQAARTALYDEKTISLHEHNIWLVTNAELNHNKNHQVVIEAVAEYNSTHSTKVFYTIIGDGDLESHLRDQIELKGLTDYVKLLGYLKNSSQYLSAFDLFVLPSKKEGLPYALLEAGKARLPVLATGVGGIPELISNQETGMIIDTDNHQKTVEALNQLLENPNLRNDLTLNLESLINQEFSLELMLEKTKSIY